MPNEQKVSKVNKLKEQTVLLGVPPFWDPLQPPVGVAMIKGYLQKRGYTARTVDMNIKEEFLEIYDRYFSLIKKYVPEDNWGNLYSIGHFVLQNQAMAHFNHSDEERDKYIELVKILVYKTFFVHFDDRQAGELIEIMDEHYSRLTNIVIHLLETENPGVVGLTANTGTYPAALFIFKLVKKLRPRIKTILGGNVFADQLAIGSPNYEYLLEISGDYIDKIMIGQGEKLLYQYLEGEMDDSKRVYTNKDIKGGTIPFPEADLPDLSDYNVVAYSYLGATGSASCKYQCSFCNSVKYYGEFRQKNIPQLVSEMTQQYNKYGVQLYFMTDAMLNPIIDDLADEFLKSDITLYYDAFFRVDDKTGDIENTLRWRRGGFYRARMGVESGSQRVLDSIGKEATLQQTRDTIKGLAYAGIKTTTYWVAGLPGETEEDFQQTLELLEELKNDIWQAEIAQFDYYYDGQASSEQWAAKRMLLYPEWAKHMLVSQSWILDCPPSREETYFRIFRFVRRCKELGIPNPYSLREINLADERWKVLHKNAVPTMMDFKKRAYIDDTKEIKKLIFVTSEWKDEGEFSF